MNGVFYIVALLSILWIVYEVWAVNKNLSNQGRILWTVFAFVFSIGAAVIYFFTFKYHNSK